MDEVFFKNLSTNELEMAANSPRHNLESQEITNDYVNSEIANLEINEKTPRAFLPKIRGSLSKSKKDNDTDGNYFSSIHSLSKPQSISIDYSGEQEKKEIAFSDLKNRKVAAKILTHKFPSNLTGKSKRK